MPEPHLRRLATSLLRWGIRVAPQETAEWGHAMLNEMNHVKGNWSALLWSLGGTGVLAKQALLSLILPSRKGRIAAGSGGELFAKEGPMSKTTPAFIGACIVASMLFFLTPVFRQAIRVSLEPLYGVMGSDCCHRQRTELKAIARQAEQKHDAEGIAFVATRIWDDLPESARLAEEAVHLDPKLIWLYAVVPGRYSSGSKLDRWMGELQNYDPQNALPYFFVAAEINRDLFNAKRIIPHVAEEPHAWQNAMAAAFRSPKYDNYCAQLKELNRRVMLRYGYGDLNRSCSGTWGPNGDTASYVESVLEAGELLEAQGEPEVAREKYLALARFGQMLGSSAPGFLMSRAIQSTYKHLAALSEKEENHEQAQLYAYLADQVERAEKNDETAWDQRARVSDVTRWNGFLASTSALGFLFSAGLLLTCLFVAIVRGRSLRLGSLRPGPLTLALGTCGSVGLLLSGAILYATYKPYTLIFQRYIRTGDETEMWDFRNFLGRAEIPVRRLSEEQFWLAVIVLCVIALFIVLTRSLVKHLRTRVA